MPRPDRRQTRQRILDAAYELFYRRGYSRVGVDAVAARAGITKRTLYNHFDSKDALLAAVLERQHAMALERIAHWAQRLPRGRGAMLDRLFGDLAGWAAEPRWSGAGFTRLVMELADLPGILRAPSRGGINWRSNPGLPTNLPAATSPSRWSAPGRR